MKKLIFALFAAAMVFTTGNKANAQGKYGPDSANCVTYLSYYHEYFKQKNYDAALPNWRKAISICAPTANQNMILDGTTLVRRLIAKNAANKEYKAALIDTLMTLHDLRIKNYPKYYVNAVNNKGLDIVTYFKGDNEKIYNGLEETIAANKEQTKLSILVNNLNAAIELYKEGKMDAETVIATYQRNVAIVKEVKPDEKTVKQEDIDKTKSDIEGLFITSKVASCDNLIALFTPRFNADPDNVELASNIVKMMSNSEDCINNDLFLRATTSMHKNEPSAQSAYFLYRLNAAQDNVAAAESYLEEAVRLSADADPKVAADYNIQYANFCIKNGHKAKAVEAAMKTLELDKDLAGRAYYIIGSVWGSTTCGGDEISRRAPYWVAVDYMQKAREADPSLADDCNKMIAQYRVYFPQTAEAFMYDITDGQSYTVSCGGMRAVTTVRTQK